MEKNIRYRLVAKINGLADTSQRLRAQIKKTKKNEKVWSLCSTKRNVGEDSRCHLLAYACLRNVPYRVLEPRCREGNKPSARLILQIIEAHSVNYFSNVPVPGIWTLEKIEAWLKNEPLPVAKRPTPTVFDRVLKVLGL